MFRAEEGAVQVLQAQPHATFCTGMPRMAMPPWREMRLACILVCGLSVLLVFHVSNACKKWVGCGMLPSV